VSPPARGIAWLELAFGMQNGCCMSILRAAFPLLLATACTAPAPAPPIEDAVRAAFLGKADTAGISPDGAEARGILALVNAAGYDLLVEEVGIGDRPAANIVNFKIGDDGLTNTADDRTFQTLEQLDDVPYVGPKVFAALLSYARAHGWVAVGPADAGTTSGWADAGWPPPMPADAGWWWPTPADAGVADAGWWWPPSPDAGWWQTWPDAAPQDGGAAD
jgi:hypothetical protein